MKVQKWSTKTLMGALTVMTLLSLGCGQDKKSGTAAPAPAPIGCTPGLACPNVGTPAQPYNYGAGTCQPGYIYTAQNCQPTAGCPANQGMFNNQCIPAMTMNNGMPNGYNYQNGAWGYNNYNNGFNSGYSGYGYGYPVYNSYYYNPYYNAYPSIGAGFSLWIR